MSSYYGNYSPPSTPQSPTPTSGSTVLLLNRQDSSESNLRNRVATAASKRKKYLRRIFKFRQMDFEYALWQMLFLFVSPQKVYRNFAYRKQTKNQWARDDPAFLILLFLWLTISSIGFSLVLKLGFAGFIKFWLWVIFIDCVGVGVVIATIMWFVANNYLLPEGSKADVEWGYSFDVHLNAFFPLLMILHLFQLPFLAFMNHNFLSLLFGNTLWLFAIGYYVYISFLGYSALPFLKKTRVILIPMTVAFMFYLISVIVGWNISAALCAFYKHRV
ncbi:DgyrCDS9021 [Dimorphilus gyrociliatus]|uniref:DgyrCDS9021 n=1 Tax=Dimorphilus gyrociliatus TaxID=2664684 RepID=A0A7I8VVV1_9ANNE|nr:DgyrCDS9021 [Dimorphilus gyrociliatus]